MHESSSFDPSIRPDQSPEASAREPGTPEFTRSAPARPRLNLSRKPGQLPLMVDMEAFFEFTFWMAEELLDLEAQYRQPLRPRDRGMGGHSRLD